MTGSLVLTGAPGAGKTSVLEALTTRLEIDGTPYGAIEAEQLAWGSPWLPPERWLTQLAAVIAMQRKAGRERFLVAATTETAAELRSVVDAIGAPATVVVCLRARPDTVAGRVAEREPDRWPGKAALIAHARELATAIPSLDGIDAIVDTDDLDPAEAAAEVHRVLFGS